MRGHGTGLLRPGRSEPWPPASASLPETRGPPVLWSWRTCGQRLALSARPAATDPKPQDVSRWLTLTRLPATGSISLQPRSVSRPWLGVSRLGPGHVGSGCPSAPSDAPTASHAGRPVSRADLGLPGPHPRTVGCLQTSVLRARPDPHPGCHGGCPGAPLGMDFRNAETRQGYGIQSKGEGQDFQAHIHPSMGTGLREPTLHTRTGMHTPNLCWCDGWGWRLCGERMERPLEVAPPGEALPYLLWSADG